MKLSLAELLAFLSRAKVNTFASDTKRSSPIRPPHSKNYVFDDPPFRYEDQYFGEFVDVGEEVVWYKGVPLWGMGYRGGIHPWAFDRRDETFDFLREALRRPEPDCPIRGPLVYSRGEFAYTVSIVGSVLSFTARETVTHGGTVVAFRDLLGGLIRGRLNSELEILEDRPLVAYGSAQNDLALWSRPGSEAAPC